MAAGLQPTVAAAPPTPPPATAAPALPLRPPLPQYPPVVLLVPPLLKGRGGDALRPTRPVGAAEVAAPTDIVARRAGTGGGAAQSDQAATRKTAVFPGSTGVAGLDPHPETEIEAGRGPETAAVAAETGGIRRGKGAGSAGTAVTVGAANTSRRPLAETETGGEKGVEVTTKRKIPRKRRIKITIKKRKQTKRRKSLKLRRREAL